MINMVKLIMKKKKMKMKWKKKIYLVNMTIKMKILILKCNRIFKKIYHRNIKYIKNMNINYDSHFIQFFNLFIFILLYKIRLF